jgi:hypothetical protein
MYNSQRRLCAVIGFLTIVLYLTGNVPLLMETWEKPKATTPSTRLLQVSSDTSN